MGDRYGNTLGEILARRSRGEDIPLPSEEDAKRLPLNRAEARRSEAMLPRSLRLEDRKRRRGLL